MDIKHQSPWQPPICVYGGGACGEYSAEEVSKQPVCAAHAKAARAAQRRIRRENANHVFDYTGGREYGGAAMLTHICVKCGYTRETTYEHQKGQRYPGVDMRAFHAEPDIKTACEA